MDHKLHALLNRWPLITKTDLGPHLVATPPRGAEFDPIHAGRHSNQRRTGQFKEVRPAHYSSSSKLINTEWSNWLSW